MVLSTDEYFDWDDYFLDDFSTSGRYPLAPGASYTLSANIEVWEDAPGGEVYMLFIADGDENLGEGDERNNTRAVPITIAVPDLLPVAFTAPPEVVLGAPAAFSWTVRNQGNTGLDSGAWSWSDGVYVSDDPKLDFDKDTFVGRTSLFGQGVIDPGEEYSLAPSYNIPTSVLGSRYFIFVADSREDWGEVDERNNTLAVPVTVVAPDLSLSAATAR